MRRLSAVAAGLALALAPCAALAQPVVQPVETHRDDRGEISRQDGGFVHRPSNYRFPAALGALTARRTITYEPGEGSLLYAETASIVGGPWISLFVYPAATPLAQEVGDLEASLLQVMPGQPTTVLGLPPLPAGGVERWFDSTLNGQPMLTGYRLVRAGDWYLKLRVNIPRAAGRPGIERALAAMAAVPWTVAPRQPQ